MRFDISIFEENVMFSVNAKNLQDFPDVSYKADNNRRKVILHWGHFIFSYLRPELLGSKIYPQPT